MYELDFNEETRLLRLVWHDYITLGEIESTYVEIDKLLGSQKPGEIVVLTVSKCPAFTRDVFPAIGRVYALLGRYGDRFAAVHEYFLTERQEQKISMQQGLYSIKRFKTEEEAMNYLFD